MNKLKYCIFLLVISFKGFAQGHENKPVLVDVAAGWAGNSINAVVFRHNSLVTYKNDQYIAFYNGTGQVVLGKRKLNTSKWDLQTTQYKGNIKDAHNAISIMVDGEGYLHLSWDHHNQNLNYCKSVAPGSLQMTEKISMTGKKEHNVTYPEFYSLANGNLLFLYRDGSSGNGNLILNRYDVKDKKWIQLQDDLIDGEGHRNAYWQMTTDDKGTIHVSWVWRESGDVATNHDICYARSKDGGVTWEKSTGEKYVLPITAATAEYALKIPQNSDLINTTSMAADKLGRPYIVTYWKSTGAEAPQYQLIYNDGTKWITKTISNRITTFSLAGGGTKRIPISRPQIMMDTKDGQTKAIVIYRDEERGSKVTAATCANILNAPWVFKDLTTESVGSWEPSYDTELWRSKKILNLFVENVDQGDGEKTTNTAPQPIKVLSWVPQW
ncbi:BNR repeat-containing protein [Mucilaginibacter sp. AW1-3]